MFILFLTLSLSGISSCILGVIISFLTKAKKKPFIVGIGISIVLFVASMILSQSVGELTGVDIFLMLVGFVTPIACVVYYLVYSYKAMNPDKVAESMERRKKHLCEKQERKKQVKEQKKREKAAIKEYERTEKDREKAAKKYQRQVIAYNEELAKEITRATIIGSDSKTKTGSAIGRAIVGDFVAGGVGSIVGASTAKKDGMTKFLVEFADGHKAVETVKDNSLRFQELIKYVQM